MSGRSPEKGGADTAGPQTRRRRVGYRRTFWVSMAVSAFFHFLAVAVYSNFLVEVPLLAPQPGSPGQLQRPAGTELVNLETLPEEDDVEVLSPPAEEEPERAAPVSTATVTGEEGAVEGEESQPGTPAPTAAERLRPRAGDLRLWAPVDPELTRPSREELMRLLLAAELENLSDSLALAEELARRVTDWTYTDDEGKRWGVSPGKLHLGDITLPLPFGFGTPAWIREQNGNRLWAWDDIERGAAAKGVRDTWRERAEAIRRRKEAERKPDTTGIRH